MENMKNIPAVDRPREKMITGGASALNDAELLAILLGSGTQEFPVLALCEHILATADHDLESLSGFSLEQLCETKGIGNAKAAIIIAAMEIGRRRLFLAHRVPKIKTEADAVALVRPYFKDALKELFVLVLLNKQFELLAISELTTPEIGAIIELAIKAGAAGFGLAGNVPLEKEFGEQLKSAADMLRLRYFGTVFIT